MGITKSAPDPSAWRKIWTICSSVNVLVFIRITRSLRRF
jgi:hypothetical protein